MSNKPLLDLPEIKGGHRKFRNLVSSYIALRHSPSRRRGTSLRMLRPMSQTDPEHSAEGHDSQEGSSVRSKRSASVRSRRSGGRLPGGSVSAEDRPGESGEVAISLSMATGGSGATTTVTSTPSAVAGAASGSVSGAVTAGGGGSAAASALGSGTPSTPINLPAVLQDRPHSGRGRVPPPVPPRSPRGGTTQTTSTSSSFSLARGGVAYLTMPPSPRFAGGSPRFSHLCSPSIGMTGYNIWHADSMCRLDKDCMMPILHAHPYERQHYVWQVPTEDVLALSPMHSGGATPDDTPHKRAFRRTNAGVAIHAMRGIYDVIKTASRPGTPTSTSSTHPSYDEGLSPSHQHSHIHSYRPSCLSRQSSVEQNKCEFVLPDTHITSTGNSPSSHSVINKTSLCLSRTSPKHSFSSCSHTAEQIAAHHSKLNRNLTLGETFSPIPLLSQSRLPDDSLSESVTSINGAISKPPSSQVNNIISKESLQESVARGRKCWGKAQELQLYNNTDMTRLFPGNMKPLSRNSFAGTERLQVEGENLKRNSLVDRPSAEEEAYIEHALTMYLGRSRSPSPFKDHLSHSSYGNSYSPSQFGGSHSQMPYSPSHTPSPVKHQSTGQLGMTSDANLGRKSSLNSELQSSLRHMSSPGLLEDLRRHHSNNADDQPQPSQVMHRTFYTEI
ncbi:putative phosphatidylinositol 4-phosphate 5-kinase type-1 beta-like 2 [Homarus americanus]|uniref:Putative phosphatidylinositol 4-phosphate 5-kinase type-1 beta-like 2 n=1 Tax=Homarus americanus TaxID=6706 RepID=A0A8J5JVF5_HOMAM|nr:putative phosphatidylinositol 4-phosphate 5-kinase type-1 beta-like 2 [Homarus americanus]